MEASRAEANRETNEEEITCPACGSKWLIRAACPWEAAKFGDLPAPKILQEEAGSEEVSQEIRNKVQIPDFVREAEADNELAAARGVLQSCVGDPKIRFDLNYPEKPEDTTHEMSYWEVKPCCTKYIVERVTSKSTKGVDELAPFPTERKRAGSGRDREKVREASE